MLKDAGQKLTSEVFFSGPKGKIEGLYTKSEAVGSPAALILPPHPDYGGTMNNKVVHYIYRMFIANGFSVLRINFTKETEDALNAEFNKGIRGLSEAATAMDWLQAQDDSTSRYFVAGYSFGSWVAMQLLMRRPEIYDFIVVSPPVGLYDFSFLAPCPTAGLVIHGTKDALIKESAVAGMITNIDKQMTDRKMTYHKIENADHFFSDKISIKNLQDEINRYLKERLLESETKILEVLDNKGEKRKRRIKAS